jgi:hypothetical protein
MRCRKKETFWRIWKKTKFLIDLYIKEMQVIRSRGDVDFKYSLQSKDTPLPLIQFWEDSQADNLIRHIISE